MKLQQNKARSLRSMMSAAGDTHRGFLNGADTSVSFADLLQGSSLYGRADELARRSVLLATTSQVTTASVLIELDGVARRIVLCPPDLSLEHLPHIIETAEVDSIISDREITRFGAPRPLYFSPCSRDLAPSNRNDAIYQETEWILLTSGTTGLPKLVVHTLASLTAAIQRNNNLNSRTVLSTFYDIRRYGGLQIFLRAALSGASLVLSDAHEATADFLARAASLGVTHISGTPSHWRRALMSVSARFLKPEYVRLSGEAVDQTILNRLHDFYPEAEIVHAFASTEAGVAFEVRDGLHGLPVNVLQNAPWAELKVEDSTLRVRSEGNARCYLGQHVTPIRSDDGFVDTKDIIELRDGRYYFAGRRDGMINVGGLKVYPEEVELIISRHPQVQMCLVRARKSPITGAVLVADVVLKTSPGHVGGDINGTQDDILHLCRETLASHKVPAAINIVPMLAISGSGKVMRRSA